ncbi:hypothetical protein BGW36DRAFT_458412 [Talaromyces proteolyticus]|uniref:Uncharacterized protein n=1 Tax=Talaromyces proteolyticus TaxID=1131652 RepID=A0AAD4KZY0_9EURO|nr:uncharacterized protein BGW36DRAFT_458412 [Talaromyces proteolyticus]KAH8701531.1 hypothetical protein BGW36DRAFT_458412 [Talaromyces proteolyticus]
MTRAENTLPLSLNKRKSRRIRPFLSVQAVAWTAFLFLQISRRQTSLAFSLQPTTHKHLYFSQSTHNAFAQRSPHLGPNCPGCGSSTSCCEIALRCR